MPAHDLPVRLSDGFQRGEIFAAVDHVPREADNVLGTPPRLRQDFPDVAQRLAELAGEVLCFPRARACPAYLARDVDGRAAPYRDAGGKPSRPGPFRRLEAWHHARSLSLNPCNFPAAARP